MFKRVIILAMLAIMFAVVAAQENKQEAPAEDLEPAASAFLGYGYGYGYPRYYGGWGYRGGYGGWRGYGYGGYGGYGRLGWRGGFYG